MLALCTLLAACHDTRPDGQVLARVDGQDITETELAAEARAAPGTRAELLDRLVGRALLAEAARRREADLSPLYLADLRRARETLLVDSLRRQIAARVPAPDDAHARAFVLAHPWAYAARAQVTLVAQDGAAIGVDTATLDQSTAASVGGAAIGKDVAIAGLTYRVAARKALPVALSAALADARSILVAQQVDRQMRAILMHARADATIHYQPGFGPAQER